MARRRLRAAGLLAAALVLGTGGAALAVPTPDSGPTAGGTTVQITLPGLVVTDISMGGVFAVGIGADRNTYAWGSNNQGSLGNGGGRNSPIPVRVTTPAGVNFTSISTGASNAIALGSDGNAYAWGSNSLGQLGNGTLSNASVPTKVSLPAGVTAVRAYAGSYTTAVLGSDGNAYMSGRNDWGQLGNGTTTDSSLPVQVIAPVGVTFTQITPGVYATVALGDDGKAYAWGNGARGELGNGTMTMSVTPTPVMTPPGVSFTDIKIYSTSAIALGSDGIAYAWGDNVTGQLGNGTMTSSLIPTPVTMPAGVTFTEVGLNDAISAALGSDGNIYTWGYNYNGDLGNGNIGSGNGNKTLVPTKVPVPAGISFAHVDVGTYGVLAYTSTGEAYAWGNNSYGQLGTDTGTAPVLTPTPVKAPQSIATAVYFDGIPGTDLTDLGNGTYSVVTPAHAPCAVDVTVDWTMINVAQPTLTYPDGFTYLGTSFVTDPSDQTITAGENATFTTAATGCPAVDTITWEVSTNGGTTWTTVTGATVSADGTTLTVTGPPASYSGNLYRATATNSEGSSISAPALLTVNTPTPTDPPTPKPTATPTDTPSAPAADVSDSEGRLAHTGGDVESFWIIGGAGLLLAGAVTLIITMFRRNRRHS